MQVPLQGAEDRLVRLLAATTLAAAHQYRVAGGLFDSRMEQPRLADAGLPGQHQNGRPCIQQMALQQRTFTRASNERRQGRGGWGGGCHQTDAAPRSGFQSQTIPVG